MRASPLLIGAAVGSVFAITGLQAFDLATESADAQNGAITKADLDGANARASAAINGYKSINNNIGKFVAEPNTLVGAKSGPIPQDRGVGGGLPTETLADGAVTEIKLSGTVQQKLNGGVQGPPGPRGPAGSDATVNGVPAGGDLTGTYPDPTIADGAVNSAKVENDSLKLDDVTRTVVLSTRPRATMSRPPDA